MNASFGRQQEQQREDKRKKGLPWREYWHLYLSLISTGILTAFAGLYLGLAPDKSGQIVFLDAGDAIRRVFFALYYAGSFLLVAEGATLFSKDKLLNRDVEEENGVIKDVMAQRRSMTAMLWVSVLAIVLTTVAAGTMLASWLGALDQFVTIPVAAQSWIVLGPPALLVFDMVMVLIYQQNSKQSELDRWVQQQKRMAEANAQEAFAHEYVRQYNEAAPTAARRAATVAAMTAARKWAGAGVNEEPTHSDGHGKSEIKDLDQYRKFTGVDMAKPGSDQTVVMEVPERPSVMGMPVKTTEEAYVPQPNDIVVGEDSHGNAVAAVVADLPLQEAQEPVADVQEAGADQPSPT